MAAIIKRIPTKAHKRTKIVIAPLHSSLRSSTFASPLALPLSSPLLPSSTSSSHLARPFVTSLLQRFGTPTTQTSNENTAATTPITNDATIPVESVVTEPSPSTVASSASPSTPPPAFLRMPSIDGLGKCHLLRWLVKVGEEFHEGDVLCEIDSDLAVIEYKAQSDGILALIRTQAEEPIVEHQILALQVEHTDQIPNAKKWNAHMKVKENKEKAELEEHEARERAEAEEELRKEKEKSG